MIGNILGNKTFGRGLVSLVVLLAMLWCGFAWAADVPASVIYSIRPLAEVEVQGVAAVYEAELAEEDAQRDLDGLPFRYALPVDMALTPDNSGTWESLSDGQSVWRLRVASPGVLSLNLGFERFFLPEAARFMVYSAADASDVRRFDQETNADHGQLWTPVFLGDEVVIELVVPDVERVNVDLELTTVGRGYRFFGELKKGLSGDCNVDVVCPEGDDWRDEIDSVGLIGLSASLLCSGTMLNNTESDGRPLFLTASHCNVGTREAPTVVVYWNFQSPTCGLRDGGTLDQTTNGSTLLARYGYSDFSLLELDQQPDPVFGVAYAGWNRADEAPASAASIHHPRSEIKSISLENDPLTITHSVGDEPAADGAYLRVADWDKGTTETGSSGSGLFDQNGRVVGQLYGGYAACDLDNPEVDNDRPDWYGRLFWSWEGGGSAATRLRDHLDPNSTGVMTADLFKPVWELAITPSQGVGFTGGLNGPFSPAERVFSVVNTGVIAVDLVLETTADWLAIDTESIALAPGQQAAVSVTLTEAATALAIGGHHAQVNFVNLATNAILYVRDVTLSIANTLNVIGPVPNPFTTPPVSIRYSLRAEATIRARVTNIRGLNVRDLGEMIGTEGENDFLWDGLDNHGRRVPSGVYVITIQGLGSTQRVNVVYAH